MPQPVVDAVIGYLKLEADTGGYEAAEQNTQQLGQVYRNIARLINCQPPEIAVMENATRAWDMAFYAIPFQPGQRILTSMAEYASNYIAYLQVAKRTGAVIQVIPNDNYGQVSLKHLEQMIDKQVKLIAITHIPTNGGLVNPAAEIGAIAREAGVCYLLDACQSIGQMSVDVETIGCDILSATGRKFLRAPRGTGFLYVRKEWIEKLEPPFADVHAAQWVSTNQYKLRDDARRFESWEANTAAKIGLNAAVDYALKWGLENIWARISLLARHFRAELDRVPKVTMHDLGALKCGILAFAVKDKSPVEIKEKLSQRQINVSVTELSSTRLDMEERALHSLVRASLHYYNTEDEIQRFCQVLRTIV
ncbi:MAG: aminotransferase class V-fold PLP-dependent enzyme [bacterium]|nr:aminotransferase class V-fold PLP-dependent enzyme [bacterium]